LIQFDYNSLQSSRPMKQGIPFSRYLILIDFRQLLAKSHRSCAANSKANRFFGEKNL
ncbi:hypothetical protein KIL84_003242, partial [Mauremys mutica]